MRGFCVLVACALALTAAAEAGMPPMPVAVAPVERGVIREVLPTVGTVRPVRDVTVGSKIAERVAAVPVEEGDPVTQGETVLCRLDTATTELTIQEARARLEEARALLAKAEAGLRPQEIQQAEAELRGLEAKVQKLEADVRRSNKLLETKVIAPSEYDAVVAERDIAQAQADAARARLALAREGTRKEDIAKARADVALRQAALDLALQRKTDSVILSPVDGAVVRKHVEVGEWTQVGGPVVEIVDTSTLRVHTYVSEKQIRNIGAETPVLLRLDAYPDRVFQGTVHRVVPKAEDASRSFPVQVNVDRPDGLVKPGMFARCEFVLAERADALLVPEDALVRRGGLTRVYKASPKPPPGAQTGRGGPPPAAGKGTAPPKDKAPAKGGEPAAGAPPPGPPMWAQEVIVKTGARQDGRVEVTKIVTGTLEAGDLVVVVGSENMRDGGMMFVVEGLPQAPEGGGPPPGQGRAPSGGAPKKARPR